ncbi:class I SAM-dependent methyltransferase [Patescibacteria group bacterium]|nr:class I SAM-dependent methyltransferase [Patescibacteria group bacterium]
MKSIKCAICKSNEDTDVLYKRNFFLNNVNARTFSARRPPDRIHYRLVKCKSCGLIFSNPIFSTEKINSLYHEGEFNYDSEAMYLKKTYFSYFKKYLDSDKIKNKKILEIGCGNGFFLQELKENGIRNVNGVEPGKPSVEKAEPEIRKNIKVDILKYDLFPKNSFDVICCFHTLDHIPDPNKFLEIVNFLLKKNGKIFFIVHNTEGFSVKLLGEHSPIFDIEHIYLFNKQNLKELFKINKFKKSVVFDIGNTYPIRYWIRLFPLNSFLKKYLIKFLEFLKLDLIPIRLNAGNIGIVAEKKY